MNSRKNQKIRVTCSIFNSDYRIVNFLKNMITWLFDIIFLSLDFCPL